MTEQQPPRPPAGLRAPGRLLWRGVAEAAELRPDETPLLVAACRLADEIAAMEEALAGSSPLVAAARGGLRVNPLIGEARAHRLAQGKLLQQLGLGDLDAVDSGLARSAAGRKMAGIRWRGKGA